MVNETALVDMFRRTSVGRPYVEEERVVSKGGGGWRLDGDSGSRSHTLFVATATTEVVYRRRARRGSGAPSLSVDQNREKLSGVGRQMGSGRSKEDMAGGRGKVELIPKTSYGGFLFTPL